MDRGCVKILAILSRFEMKNINLSIISVLHQSVLQQSVSYGGTAIAELRLNLGLSWSFVFGLSLGSFLSSPFAMSNRICSNAWIQNRCRCLHHLDSLI